jgi:ankyrin repeat protein
VVTGDLEETRRLAPVSPLALRGLLLLSAAQRGDAELVAALLEQDADPNTGVSSLVGEVPCTLTALHVAAKGGHVAVAQALLAEGAQASPGAAEGKPTPLHLAAQRGHLPFVRLLVAAGADRAACEDGFGATPAGWAALAGHSEIAALLAVDESPSAAE